MTDILSEMDGYVKLKQERDELRALADRLLDALEKSRKEMERRRLFGEANFILGLRDDALEKTK